MSVLLEIRDRTKLYRRDKRANAAISLSFPEPSTVPLSAGNPPRISKVTGMLRPSSGSVLIHGREAIADPARRRSGRAGW